MASSASAFTFGGGGGSVLFAMSSSFLFCGVRHAAAAQAIAAAARPKQPLQIFLLAGQSNMVGMASIKHLDLLVQQQQQQQHQHQHQIQRRNQKRQTRGGGGGVASSYSNEYRQALWNGTSYKVRNDVYMKFNDNDGEHGGPLTVGPHSGFAAKNCFGPELMFGWTMGDALSQQQQQQQLPLFLLKTAYGGRSLAVDFRPPSSGEPSYPHPHTPPSHYGWQYRAMVLEILDTLDSLENFVPGFNKTVDTFELKGMVWFQGWNDVIDGNAVNEYAFNLANFIRDIRLDLDAPGLPVIVGELGMHGLVPTGRGAQRVKAFRAAQQSVTLLDEFKNTTLFVRTAPYVVLNGTHYGGGYHYFGRADTYFHIGQAFAKGMLQLLGFEEKQDETDAAAAVRREAVDDSKNYEKDCSSTNNREESSSSVVENTIMNALHVWSAV